MNHIGALILAAGNSSRFGELKQLTLLDNKPLFTYPVDLVKRMNFHSVVLVGNERTAEMRDYCMHNNIKYVENPHYKTGMSSSLKQGVLAFKDDIQAIILLLGDQPFIQEQILESLISTYNHQYHNGVRIVRASYNGQVGHPVLFDQSFFPLLTKIEGDKGAKLMIEDYVMELAIVDFSNDIWNLDIDTPIDYQRANRFMEVNKT
jgi:molybdenum cofactor cytidylyltransferase